MCFSLYQKNIHYTIVVVSQQSKQNFTNRFYCVLFLLKELTHSTWNKILTRAVAKRPD